MTAAADSAPLAHADLVDTAAVRGVAIDIAWDRPTVAQIQATGAVGVLRYSSDDSTKNLTAAEVTAYHAAGLGTALVRETTTGRATQGYQAGVDDASAAVAQLQADGLPTEHPVYFAVDEDTSWASVEPYFRGANDVLGADSQGVPLAGTYGGFDVIEGAYAFGLRHLWQTLAWSSGRVSSHAVLYQDGRTVLSGNADINQILAADWGQYPRPEADMTPDDLLNAPVPGAKMPNGYVPKVWELLNGAKTADTQLTALAASEAALKTELDGVKATAASVLTAVQGILSSGNATEAEVQAGIQAELAKLGALLGSVK